MLRSGSSRLARGSHRQPDPCLGLDLLGTECLRQLIVIQPIQYSGSGRIVFLLGDCPDLFAPPGEDTPDQRSMDCGEKERLAQEIHSCEDRVHGGYGMKASPGNGVRFVVAEGRVQKDGKSAVVF